MYILVNLMIKFPCCRARKGSLPPGNLLTHPWVLVPRLRTTAIDSHSRVNEGITVGSCTNVQCYLTKVGFALFSPNMSSGTCATLATLSRMKWPLPNQSKHSPLLKNYKTYADLDITTWKNSSKNMLQRKWNK